MDISARTFGTYVSDSHPTVNVKLSEQDIARQSALDPACFDRLQAFKHVWKIIAGSTLLVAGVVTTLLAIMVCMSGSVAFGGGIVVTAGPGALLLLAGAALMVASDYFLADDKLTDVSYTGRTYLGPNAERFHVFYEDFETNGLMATPDDAQYTLKKNPVGVYPKSVQQVLWRHHPDGWIAPVFIRTPAGDRELYKFDVRKGWIKKTAEEIAIEQARATSTVRRIIHFFSSHNNPEPAPAKLPRRRLHIHPNIASITATLRERGMTVDAKPDLPVIRNGGSDKSAISGATSIDTGAGVF